MPGPNSKKLCTATGGEAMGGSPARADDEMLMMFMMFMIMFTDLMTEISFMFVCCKSISSKSGFKGLREVKDPLPRKASLLLFFPERKNLF